VYRGSLACGQLVAIKLSKASAQASKDFLREVDIITKLQHPRIVPLTGVCVEGRNLISVYSYLPRGSLEDNLHGTSTCRQLHVQLCSCEVTPKPNSPQYGGFASKEPGILQTTIRTRD
jgi:serine/threonine protein kinase